MKNIRTVILANPTSPSDPIFFEDADGYLFPKVIQKLQELDVIHDPVISVHKNIAKPLLQTLEQFGVPCHLSERPLPQHRLEEFSETDDSDAYLLLTPYSYLLESERIVEATEILSNSDIQLVNFKGYSSSSAFCLCDKRAVKELAKQAGFAITPFVAAHNLKQTMGEDAVYDFELSPRDLACSFLYMLLYSGDGGILSQDFIADYLKSEQSSDVFSRSSHVRYLSEYYSIACFDEFSMSLAEVIKDFRLESLAAQIHYIKRLLPFFPEKRGRFLELGFGFAPIASLFLLNLFESGYAIEPFCMKRVGCSVVEFLSKNMSIPGYIDLKETRNCKQTLERLEISDATVEESNLPDGSIDFIFSKTVFEHVKDVERTSQVLYDLLSENGCMYHIVDFRDHVDTSTIRFDFLKHDKETWASMNETTNLWRVNDIISLWEEMGFEVTVVEKLSRPQPMDDIHPCWDNYAPEDLFCYHAVLTAVKK